MADLHKRNSRRILPSNLTCEEKESYQATILPNDAVHVIQQMVRQWNRRNRASGNNLSDNYPDLQKWSDCPENGINP